MNVSSTLKLEWNCLDVNLKGLLVQTNLLLLLSYYYFCQSTLTVVSKAVHLFYPLSWHSFYKLG